jgi:hypothetical protein
MKHDNNYWLTLDIIHLWCDWRHYPVSIADGKIFITTPENTNEETIVICQFINVLTTQQWTFSIVQNQPNNHYSITFFPKPEPGPEPEPLTNLFNL